MSVLDTLKAATPSRRSVTLYMDGAAQAEWDQANEGLQDAASEDEKTLSLAAPALTAVVERMEDARTRMLASKVVFDFERVPWPKRMAIQAANTPRENHIPDRVRGYNVETYFPALIRASCVQVTGADGDVATEIPDALWDGLLGTEKDAGSLNFQQLEQLSSAAQFVNDGETQVPPSARSLLVSQDSGASLAQPSPGTSPRSVSKGGSRPTSRKSSTTQKAASSGT